MLAGHSAVVGRVVVGTGIEGTGEGETWEGGPATGLTVDGGGPQLSHE